jgi:hypothetical protein
MAARNRKRQGGFSRTLFGRLKRGKRQLRRFGRRLLDRVYEARIRVLLFVVQKFPHDRRIVHLRRFWNWVVSADNSPHQIVGKCIYCSSAKQLSNEHIVPINLGGTRILYRASCEECRNIILRVETACLAEMRNIRHERGLRLRRSEAKAVATKAWILTSWDGTSTIKPPGEDPSQIWEQRDIPYEQCPIALSFPKYKIPGIWRGLRRQECSEAEAFCGRWNYHEPAETEHPAPLWIEGRVGNMIFLRMIAKIAHCFAVWNIGIDNFQPFLTDFILGKSEDNVFYYIGGYPDPPPNTNTTHIHLEYLKVNFDPAAKDEEVKNVLVTVRLFGDIGAPPYFVVVGKSLGN